MKKYIWFAALLVILIALFVLLKKSWQYTESKPQTPPTILNKVSEVPTHTVQLLFPDTFSEYLRKETVAVPQAADTISLIKNVLSAIISGPTDTTLVPTIPSGTKLINVYTNNKEIIVNFSNELVTNLPGGSNGEIMTIYSIVDALLLNFPQYTTVQLLVNGKQRNTLKGHIDISRPIYFNPDFIYKSYRKDSLETK